MKENLPPIISGWIENLYLKSNSESIRYNYYTMLNNVKNEIIKETSKFESTFANQSKKLVNKLHY